MLVWIHETMFMFCLAKSRKLVALRKWLPSYVMRASLTWTGLYKASWGGLAACNCFCVFLIYLNFLFYYLFTILSHITIQYLQTYNTYILLDGLVCSIMRYLWVMLYFGEPIGHVKIQDTSKNIPQYYTLDHPVISFNSRSTK